MAFLQMYLRHNYTESMEPNREFLKVPCNWCGNALIKRKTCLLKPGVKTHKK